MSPRARCQPSTRIVREPQNVHFAEKPEYRSSARSQPSSMPKPSYTRTSPSPCVSCYRGRDVMQGIRDQILSNASRHFRANIRAIEQILGRNVHAQEIFDVVLHGSVPRLLAALVSRGGMMYGPRGKYRLAEKVFWQGPETAGVGAALEGLLGRMARAMAVYIDELSCRLMGRPF